MLEILSSELIYVICDYLRLGDIENLRNTHHEIRGKLDKYIIKLVFVNHKRKLNTIFELEYEYFIKNQVSINNILNQILVNDFCFQKNTDSYICYNIITGIDIYGYAVLEYYISYLKRLNYYIFPNLNLKYLKKEPYRLELAKVNYQPDFEIYLCEMLPLDKILKKYIVPIKKYNDIIYFNEYENLFNSNLI